MKILAWVLLGFWTAITLLFLIFPSLFALLALSAASGRI